MRFSPLICCKHYKLGVCDLAFSSLFAFFFVFTHHQRSSFLGEHKWSRRSSLFPTLIIFTIRPLLQLSLSFTEL